ncbi:hypothetical protein CPY51_22050 [Rhizobium tubonense]|uniref:Uncharacterized protein n=1 Tax=Rhizobium tubonense TaxID=484088 RepID=A0A2W4EI11_9HYPH|nr:hypothetical protein CPY51_22050 [Rhizobium tubonense]
MKGQRAIASSPHFPIDRPKPPGKRDTHFRFTSTLLERFSTCDFYRGFGRVGSIFALASR